MWTLGQEDSEASWEPEGSDFWDEVRVPRATHGGPFGGCGDGLSGATLWSLFLSLWGPSLGLCGAFLRTFWGACVGAFSGGEEVLPV